MPFLERTQFVVPETNKDKNGSQVKLLGEIEKFCIWHPDILEVLERSTLISRPTTSEKVSIFSSFLFCFLGVVHTKWWENIKCILPCKHSVCKKYSHKFLSKFSYCSSNSKPHWISHKQITICRIFSCLEKHNYKDHSKSILVVL